MRGRDWTVEIAKQDGNKEGNWEAEGMKEGLDMRL